MNPMAFLERYLSLTSQRHTMIVSNMANIDTPGYRTRDVDFRGELLRLSQNGGNPRLSSMGQQVQGLVERPDGNNVNLDREGMLMSETQLQYQMGVQLIKHQFHSIMSAINGGN